MNLVEEAKKQIYEQQKKLVGEKIDEFKLKMYESKVKKDTKPIERLYALGTWNRKQHRVYLGHDVLTLEDAEKKIREYKKKKGGGVNEISSFMWLVLHPKQAEAISNNARTCRL